MLTNYFLSRKFKYNENSVIYNIKSVDKYPELIIFSVDRRVLVYEWMKKFKLVEIGPLREIVYK